MAVFSGNANRELAESIARHLGFPLGKLQASRFSDGEVSVEVLENVRGRDVFIVQSTCPPVNDNLLELLIMVDALRRASAARITAVIPYYGYARQDRRPRAQRVAISAKLVANMITHAGVDRVLTVDLHADQIQGFFDIPVDNVYASPVLLHDAWKQRYQNMIVVSPDVGGVVRARALAKLAVPFRIGAGILGAIRAMRADRPAVVVGFGGYPTIPAMSAALALRIPRMIHEQNGVPGRVNTVFAKRVDAVCCGVWPTALPEGVQGIHTGNPVRAAVLERAAAGYIPPGDYPMSLLVIGGSQGARILSDVVPAAVARLPAGLRDRLRVAHQARDEDMARVEAAYAEAGIRAEVQPFFRDIPRRLSEAQLVVSRAGASSVADISVIGRPSVLIPFAAATADHQSANARGLVDAGAAILIPESRLDPEVLSVQMTAVLDDPAAATRMARNALAQGRPDATERLVALVEDLRAKGRQ